MDDLSATLQRERELLDQLRFRFVETRLLLAAGELRYLGWATEEIHQARMRATEADLLRAAQVQRIAAECDRRHTPTLREVAARSGRPWAGILRDHHEGLCAMVSEIEVIGHRNAELARAGLHELAERSGPSLFDGWLGRGRRTGERSPAATATVILDSTTTLSSTAVPMADRAVNLADEQAFQDVITTATRLRMPALLAFLR